MRTIIFVDGFNLYFRLLRARPADKWLNPKLLAENVLSPANIVTEVNYYTARVSGRLDVDAPRRQQVYFDALSTVPEVKIHMGMFLSKEKWAALVHPPQFMPPLGAAMAKPWADVVKILKTEEKGSDVNLASHLLFKTFRNEYDVAAVISNDSDLVEPIRLATQEMGKIVGLLSPVNNPNPQLAAAASFVRRIRPNHLTSSQLNNPLTLEDGTVLTRPPTWV